MASGICPLGRAPQQSRHTRASRPCPPFWNGLQPCPSAGAGEASPAESCLSLFCARLRESPLSHAVAAARAQGVPTTPTSEGHCRGRPPPLPPKENSCVCTS
eukprot:scaffold136615_cov35-Tisochrysis_lutea.AAC.1